MKKLLLLAPLLFLVACNPKKDTKVSPARSNTTGTLGGFSNTQSCMNGTSNIGSIYDAGQSGATGSFEDRVKDLLSATVASSEVGTISSAATDPTGLRFSGIIKLDSNGAVIASASSMLIKVYDSYTLSGQDPIPLEFSSSKGAQISGQFTVSTGVGYINYTDNYGSVRFEGRLDAQSFSGVVKFQNLVNVNGGSGASGTLGQFYVARCGIIQ